MSVEALKAYFAEREARTGERLRLIDVFWGDEPATPDERAAAVLGMLRQVDSGEVEFCDRFEEDREQIDVREFVVSLPAPPPERGDG